MSVIVHNSSNKYQLMLLRNDFKKCRFKYTCIGIFSYISLKFIKIKQFFVKLDCLLHHVYVSNLIHSV